MNKPATPAQRHRSIDVDLTVVGGGIAGLVAAREAAREGARVAIIESAPDVGGLVGAHQLDGLTLDSGAESFATRGGSVAALIENVGLGADIVLPARVPARVHAGGRSLPMPSTGVLGIPTDFEVPGLAEVLGDEGLARARQDVTLPASTGAQASSLADLVRTRMGGAVVDRLLRPVVRGVHSLEPEDLGAEDLLPGLGDRLAETGSLAAALARHRAAAPAGSAVQGLSGGIHRLIAALTRDLHRLGAHVLTGTPCRSLQTTTTAWIADTATGPVRSARVLVACPPDTWDFLSRLPDLSALAARWPGPTGADLITLVLDAAQLPDHAGAGVLVADPGQGAKALTYASAKWEWLARQAGPDRVVIRLSYAAGIIEPGPVHSERRAAQAAADAARLLGIDITPGAIRAHAHHHHRMPHPVLGRGMSAQVSKVRRLSAATPGLEVAGAWLAGTGLAAVVPDARAAAQRLLSI